MRYLQFLIPLLTLPFLAAQLDVWRYIANTEAAKTLDLAPARFVSEVTLLILVLSFAATAAWIIRQRWTSYTAGVVYCLVGFLVMFRRPLADLMYGRDTALGPIVSDHMMTNASDSLLGISWALFAALGVIMLLLDTFPPKKSTTPSAPIS
jgi:hypothetical protein